jgi:hypothetical protein
MNGNSTATVFTCPMHRDVRQQGPGKCPKCGMALLAEGTRFALLRHMAGKPIHLTLMLTVMLVLMATIMMMLR